MFRGEHHVSGARFADPRSVQIFRQVATRSVIWRTAKQKTKAGFRTDELDVPFVISGHGEDPPVYEDAELGVFKPQGDLVLAERFRSGRVRPSAGLRHSGRNRRKDGGESQDGGAVSHAA